MPVNKTNWLVIVNTGILCVFSTLIVTVDAQSCNVTQHNITVTTTELTTITSPGYNGGTGTYQSNMDCWWVIDSGAADLKLLIFLHYNTSCPGDKVFIYDGDSNTASKLANGLCGSSGSTPTPYSTTQRYARVEMTSDASDEKAGISMDIVAAKDYSGTGCTSTQTLTSSSTYQFLSSPNFPGKYSSRSDCRWALTNDGGYLNIDVIISDVEDDTPGVCDYDKYIIYDGPHKCDHNDVKMICSQYPKVQPYNLTSTESTVTVTLFSDGSVNKRGFLLRYRAVDPTTTIANITVAPTTSQTTTSKPKGFELKLELLIGMVFGSLLLICFTIVVVVIIVKKVNVPSERTISSVHPYRNRPIKEASRKKNDNRNTQSNKRQSADIKTISAW